MRVIVPAAGRGTRLLPLTAFSAKALVPVCAKPLLSYTLEWLADLAVPEVVVVLGHRGDELRRTLSAMKRRPRLIFVDNPLYGSTNSVLSLFLTVPSWTERCCVIDSDVLASPALLQRLIAEGPSALVVDTTKDFESADMKVELRGTWIAHLDKTIERPRH